MTPKTFIFIGRSGSGKGTQAVLLRQYLEGIEFESNGAGEGILPPRGMKKVFHVMTGDLLRAFVKEDTYTSKLIKEALEKGLLMPEFTAILMWATFFSKNLTGNEHIIGDGMPRKLNEAMMLVDAMKFYKREKPIIIFLDVSRESVVERLIKRGRSDDKSMDAIKERMAYYEKDVVPVVEYFKNSPDCDFMHIDGEPGIPEIYHEILKRLEEKWQKEK